MPNTPLKQLDYNGLLYFWTLLKAKLGDKVDKETGKGLSTNDYTTVEQTKLSGIETGAEVNTIEGIKVNGTLVNPDGNKIVDITVPTVVSDLTNDAGYITSADLPTNVSELTNDANYQTDVEVAQAIEDALADITGIEFQIVASYSDLPVTGEKGVIYLVPNSGSAPNSYDEYVWIVVSDVGRYEKIGTTNIDLSGYVQFTDLTPITNQEIDTICNT